MTIQIKSIICPQCGATGSSRVTGTPNLYACNNCKAEFVLSDSNAPKSVHVVHSMAPDQFEQLRKSKFILALGAGLVALMLLAPFIVQLFRQAVPPPQPLGRLEESTVYQIEGGKVGYVRVLESGAERSDRYSILFNDLAGGKRTAQPQVIEFPRGTGSRRPAIKHFLDGSVYLILNEQRLMRLEPAGPRFVDMNDELVNHHPQALSLGLAKVEFGFSPYPDRFKVTTNGGEVYYLHWPTQQIVRDSDAYNDLRKRQYDTYSASEKRFALAGLESDGSRMSSINSPSLLVHYMQKVRAGEYTDRPTLTLSDAANASVRNDPARYVAVAPEWVMSKGWLAQVGIADVALVQPPQKRFNATLLAQNATRLLIAFSPTPVSDQGRILQLIDTASDAVVWSRTVEQLPQITREGVYVSADAIASGFYIVSDQSTPSLLIDNDGHIAHDFRDKIKE